MKINAGCLLCVIVTLLLSRQNRELSVLLTILVSCMVFLSAAGFLRPVLDFAENLQEIADSDMDYLNILMKAAGIGLISEISAAVCADAGNAVIGKILQISASFLILWLSLPVMNRLLEFIRQMLGAI